jgi:hypothetical protein
MVGKFLFTTYLARIPLAWSTFTLTPCASPMQLSTSWGVRGKPSSRPRCRTGTRPDTTRITSWNTCPALGSTMTGKVP